MGESPPGDDFSNIVGENSQRGEERKFKTFGDELILYILQLQMKSKKKRSEAYILVIFKLILDVLELQLTSKNKKVLGDDCIFKLSKGGDLKKRVWETLL